MKRAGVINLILFSCSKTSLSLRNWAVLEKLKPILRTNRFPPFMLHKRPIGKIHYNVHYSPPLDIVLSHVNPFHPLPLYHVLSISILPPPSTARFHQNGAFLISAMRTKRPVHRIRPSLRSCPIHNKLFVSVTGLKPFATQSWQTIPYRRPRLAVNIF
jgi:hypothetical protein